MHDSVYIVIPAYNEGRVVQEGIRPLLEAGYRVIAVDDGSSDDTYQQLCELPIHALRHPINLGQGAALQTGMSYALQLGAEAVVHFDADGQHQVEDIPTLLEPVLSGQADIVLGSRFLRKSDSESIPSHRRMVLRVGVWVNAVLTGVWLTDAHNGFRVLGKKALTSIHLYENRMAHASEILVRMRRAKLTYVERPTTIIYTDYSQEKGQSGWNGVHIVIDLILRRLFR